MAGSGDTANRRDKQPMLLAASCRVFNSLRCFGSAAAAHTKCENRGCRRRENKHAGHCRARRSGSVVCGDASWPRMLVFSLYIAAFLSPVVAQQPLPPSKLTISDFGNTSLNASWAGPAGGQSTAASYDLRWKEVGNYEWMAGRELAAPDSSFVVTGENEIGLLSCFCLRAIADSVELLQVSLRVHSMNLVCSRAPTRCSSQFLSLSLRLCLF